MNFQKSSAFLDKAVLKEFKDRSGRHVHFDPETTFESDSYYQRKLLVDMPPRITDIEDEEHKKCLLKRIVLAAGREVYISGRCTTGPNAMALAELIRQHMYILPNEPTFIYDRRQMDDDKDSAATIAEKPTTKHVRFASDCNDSHYAYGTTVHQMTTLEAKFFKSSYSAKLIRAGSFETYKWNADNTAEDKARRYWGELPSRFNNQCVSFKEPSTCHWHYRILGREKSKRSTVMAMLASWFKKQKELPRPAPLQQRIDLD